MEMMSIQKKQIKNNDCGPRYIWLHQKTNLFLIKILGDKPEPDHVDRKEDGEGDEVKFEKHTGLSLMKD